MTAYVDCRRCHRAAAAEGCNGMCGGCRMQLLAEVAGLTPGSSAVSPLVVEDAPKMTPKKPKKQPKKKPLGRPRKGLSETRVSVSLTPALEEKVRSYCEQTGRGFADAIRSAVRAWVPTVDYTDLQQD